MKFISAVCMFLAAIPFAEACDKHKHEKHQLTTHASSPLPDESIYNLESPWLNQNGETLNLTSLAGKQRLVAMVFTSCQTACPLLIQDLKSVMARLDPQKSKDLKISLFSFDSERETTDSLKAFMKKFSLDQETWSAHRASKESVAELAAALGVQYKKLESGGYIHSNFIFLLDENGIVKARKDGLGKVSEDFVKALRASL